MKCADERWRHGEGPTVVDLRVPAMTSKPSGVADYLASPERAVAPLNRVIAGGGNLKEIR